MHLDCARSTKGPCFTSKDLIYRVKLIKRTIKKEVSFIFNFVFLLIFLYFIYVIVPNYTNTLYPINDWIPDSSFN